MKKLVALTRKPVGSIVAINNLLGPHLRARSTGFESGRLNFKTDEEHSDETIADAPKGWFPSSYTVVPNPEDYDPTGLLSVARGLAEEKSITSLIGRSSILAESYSNFDITTQFATWWRTYNTVALLALQAEKKIDGGTRTRLSPNRDTFDTDGHIAAFLAMTGSLVGTEFGMSESDEIDVATVYNKAIALLKPYIDACNEPAFKYGLAYAGDYIGDGTLPHDGSAITALPASVFEKLYENPYKATMRNPHARKLLRTALASRIPASLCGIPGVSDRPFIITEGTDKLVIPKDILELSPSPQGVVDAMFQIVDDMQPLTTSDYTRSNWEFTDQFRNLGELVQAIFVDQTVDYTQYSYLNVLLSHIREDTIQTVLGSTVSHHTWGTGGLGTVDLNMNNRINVISGMQEYYHGYSRAVSGQDISMSCELPNGALYLGDGASCTALQWMDFLRWYGRSISPEMRRLNEKTGATKKDLKSVSVTLASGDGTGVASWIANSQRNGVLSKAYASFNLQKFGRVGQQGPSMIDLTSNIGPAVVANANEWTRAESDGILRRVSLRGDVIAPHYDGVTNRPTYGSEFVGEPQGSKAPSPLITPRIPTTNQLGYSDVNASVYANLASLPTNMARNQTLQSVNEYNGPNSLFYNRGYFGTSSGNDQSVSFGLYQNLHPTEGFKRGYFLGSRGRTISATTPSNHLAALAGWTRETTTISAAVSMVLYAGQAAVTRNFPTPAGLVGGGSVTALEDYVSTDGWKLLAYGNENQTDNSIRSIWFWDPSRTVSVGPGQHTLYGETYEDVCLSAAQTHFVEVGSGAVQLRDIGADNPSGMNLGSATFYPRQSSGAPANLQSGAGFCQSRDLAFLSPIIEQGEEAYPVVMINNGWRDRLDIVSEEWAFQHASGMGGITPINRLYGAHTTGANPTSLAQISPFRKTIGVLNAHMSHPFNRNTSFGLNATDGQYTAAVTFPEVGHDHQMVHYFDGCNFALANEDVEEMIIQGNGLCRDGYMSDHTLSVINYLLRTELDAPLNAPISPYPLAEFADQAESVLKLVGRRLVNNHRVVPLLPNLSVNQGIHALLGNNPAEAFTTARWFITNAAGVNRNLPEYMADLRGSELYGATNPWKRGESDGYGFEVLQYSPSIVMNETRHNVAKAMRMIGEFQTAGFTNELWRDIQTQGV